MQIIVAEECDVLLARQKVEMVNCTEQQPATTPFCRQADLVHRQTAIHFYRETWRESPPPPQGLLCLVSGGKGKPSKSQIPSKVKQNRAFYT